MTGDPCRAPVVLSYGVGVDSTALLVELVARGEPPDLVQTADTGSERDEFYRYLEMMQAWMDTHRIAHEVVRYEPKRFKHWPPYGSLHANALTNATLPSISLGRHSCSLKWKRAPADASIKAWPPARAAWARGERVIRLIGYDASPADTRRWSHAVTLDEPLFDIRYPLRDWGWTREDCVARIKAEGLPVPLKSACWMCLGMKAEEVETLPARQLRLIVLMEARAAPRLRTVEGLWRKGTRTRPGRMTDFIRARRLLPADEIDAIIADAPTELVAFQEGAAALPLERRPSIETWLEQFNTRLEAAS